MAATGATHPFGGRRLRYPFWKHRDTGVIHGPDYINLSDTATISSDDPGDATRAANKTAIIAAAASAATQKKALLVDGTFWWDAGASQGLIISNNNLQIIGRARKYFPSSVEDGDRKDGFIGKISTAPTSPNNGIHIASSTNQQLWNLRIGGVGASVRGTSPGHHGIYAGSVTNLKIINCDVVGPTAAGFLINGFTGCYIARCTNNTSLADSFHYTGTSTEGYLENCSSEATGDDYYAVVSYSPQLVSNVTMRRSTGQLPTSGSRIAVSGGNNILFQDLRVSEVKSHGIYIASEGSPYFTAAITNVTYERVSVGYLSQGGFNSFNVLSSFNSVSDVNVIDCSVGRNASNAGFYVYGALTNGVTFTNCASHYNASQPGILISNSPKYVTFDSCIINTASTNGLYNTSGSFGTNLTLRDCTITTAGYGFNLDAYIDTVTLTGNTFIGPNTGTYVGLLLDIGSNNVTIENNTISNFPQWGIRAITTAFTGFLDIIGNTFNDISKTGANPESFFDAISIGVDSPAVVVRVIGNTHNNPNSNEYQFDWDVGGQTTAGAHQCTGNIRGTNTGGNFANYASDATNDAGFGIRRIAAAGWTVSGNT